MESFNPLKLNESGKFPAPSLDRSIVALCA